MRRKPALFSPGVLPTGCTWGSTILWHRGRPASSFLRNSGVSGIESRKPSNNSIWAHSPRGREADDALNTIPPAHSIRALYSCSQSEIKKFLSQIDRIRSERGGGLRLNACCVEALFASLRTRGAIYTILSSPSMGLCPTRGVGLYLPLKVG